MKKGSPISYIAPFLSPEVEAEGVDFFSSDLLFARDPNKIPVSTANAPATMAYMNTSSAITYNTNGTR
jgi:hypothetical protein